MQAGVIVALAVGLLAGQGGDVRQLYDAGRYQDVVKATDQSSAGNEQGARLQYLAAQSYAKLNDADGAKRAYQKLADTGANAWASVGESGVQLIDKQLTVADSANQPTGWRTTAGGTLSTRRRPVGAGCGDAASAFTKATQLDRLAAFTAARLAAIAASAST